MSQVLRPSSAARWMACPASAHLAAIFGDGPDSAPAKEGRAAHKLLELCLAEGDRDATIYLGVEHTDNDGEIFGPFDANMARGVNLALDTIYNILESQHEFHVESKVYAVSDADTDGRYRVEGTADCRIYDPAKRHLHVFDLKYGFRLVEVDANKQLLTYAVGAVKSLHNQGVDAVTIWIVQPRAPHPEGLVRNVTMTADQIRMHEFELFMAIEAIKSPEPVYNPGDHCRYCHGETSGTCNARATQALNVFTEIVPPKEVPAWSPVILGERLQRAQAVLSYYKAIVETANRYAQQGMMPAGYKWVLGRGSRGWAQSDEETAAHIKACLGVDVRTVSVPSPYQLEQTIGKKQVASIPKRKVIDEKTGKEIEVPVIEKRSGRPTLARLDDPRDAYSPTANAFAGFEAIIDERE